MTERAWKGFNTKEEWEAAERDHRSYQWLYANVKKHLRPGASIGKVLDVGCGRAYFLECCVQNGIAKERLFGIEAEPDSFAFCAAQGFQVASVDLEKDPLPYADRSFSVIICSQLIEHISRDAGSRLIAELYRVLADDGLLLIYSPSHFNRTGRTMPFHVYCWKPYELRDRLREVGFKGLITKIAPMQWYDLKPYNEAWHQAKYRRPLSFIEQVMRYSVYALFLVTRSQRLLSQSAFAAYRIDRA